MKDLINWLIEAEKTALRIYSKAAIFFKDDKDLADFVNHLAKDEESHLVLLENTLKHIGDKQTPQLPFISVDYETRKTIEPLLAEYEDKIDKGRITKQEFFSCIALVEFHEWTDIKVYVANVLMNTSRGLIPQIHQMQQHKEYIRRYFETKSGLDGLAAQIKKTPDIWKEKLLVVDDEEIIVDLMKAILENEGIVEGVGNGKKALEKISRKYYSVIITDVEMPVMNGIEFYKKAVQAYPHLKERILFYTSNNDIKNIHFFEENNLKYLIKPVPINEIKSIVIDILNRQK